MSAPNTEPNTWKMCNKEEPLLSVGFVLKTSLQKLKIGKLRHYLAIMSKNTK